MSTNFFLVLVIAAILVFVVYRARLWLSRAEPAVNSQRKFGASSSYIKLTVMFDGQPVRLLMTQHELTVARERAASQPEEFTNDNNS